MWRFDLGNNQRKGHKEAGNVDKAHLAGDTLLLIRVGRQWPDRQGMSHVLKVSSITQCTNFIIS